MLEMIPSYRFDVSYDIIIAGVVGDRGMLLLFFMGGVGLVVGFVGQSKMNSVLQQSCTDGPDDASIFIFSYTDSKSSQMQKQNESGREISRKSSIMLQQYCCSTW